MREIKFRVRDEEYPVLKKKKGKKSWRELVFDCVGMERKEVEEK